MLARTFGCVRVVWNRTLAARRERYAAEGKQTSHAETDRALTAMKKDPDFGFLNEVSSVPLQQALRHQHPKAGLNKSLLDAGLGEFRRQLGYKCERYGRALVVIDRWYPSSKTCSFCGYQLEKLALSTRHWQCPSCGTRHDRDLNAAKNILAAGLAVARSSPGDACGADVRHPGSSRMQPAAKQEPRPVRAGIPAPKDGE
jgi:transposase